MSNLEFDEKLTAIDQLYTQTEQLLQNYREYLGSAYESALRDKCMENIKQMEHYSQVSGVELGSFTQTMEYVLGKPEATQNVSLMEEMILRLQQNIKKMYLAAICDEGTYRKVKLKNYYGTAYGKKALICYIVYPFLYSNAAVGHTNQQEVRVMAQILHEMGYDIDIINTRYTGELIPDEYEVMIGSGSAFDDACSRCVGGTKKIYYLTEASPYFANVAELQRLRNFQKRNHCELPFERQANNRFDLQTLALMDAAICIGNQWTMSTYEGMFQKIYPLDVSGFQLNIQPDFESEIGNMQKNFMWYGGAGPVHKGLDLCIEAFRKLPDLNLHIVGEPNEKFYDFYRKDIEEGQNIYYYGFLNKDSQEFLDVCKTCAYCVSPSCSEGQSTSVLTAMFAGMIPVCTVQTGIDLEKCGGVYIEDIEIDGVCELLRSLSQYTEDEVKQRRMAAYEYVCQEHTLDSYRRNMEYILSDIMREKGEEL